MFCIIVLCMNKPVLSELVLTSVFIFYVKINYFVHVVLFNFVFVINKIWLDILMTEFSKCVC